MIQDTTIYKKKCEKIKYLLYWKKIKKGLVDKQYPICWKSGYFVTSMLRYPAWEVTDWK